HGTPRPGRCSWYPRRRYRVLPRRRKPRYARRSRRRGRAYESNIKLTPSLGDPRLSGVVADRARDGVGWPGWHEESAGPARRGGEGGLGRPGVWGGGYGVRAGVWWLSWR